MFDSPIMVYFQHHSLRPGSELFSFSRTSSVWSGALNHSTKEYTTGVMCFWPILAIRLDQLHKAGKILELLLRQSKKMSAPPKDEQEPSASLSVDETTTTEKKRKKTRTTKEEVKTNSSDHLSKYFEKDIVKKWMRIEPTLANTDLRPYYFVCTEREDFFFESTDEKIRELFSAVNAGKYAMASKKQDIENLSSDEAKILFSKVTQSIFKNNLSDTTPPSQIEGLQQLVTIRTELQESLTDFLLALPVENIGMWAVGSWDSCIPKTSPAWAKLCEFYKQFSEKNKDRFVKSAAATAAKG